MPKTAKIKLFINYKRETYMRYLRHLKLALDRFKCTNAYISRLFYEQFNFFAVIEHRLIQM